MPCQKILFDASLGDNMSEWYGTMTIRNMHHEDGTPVRVQEFLGVRFMAPPLSGAVTMQAQLKARQTMTPEITTTKMGGGGKMGGQGEGKMGGQQGESKMGGQQGESKMGKMMGAAEDKMGKMMGGQQGEGKMGMGGGERVCVTARLRLDKGACTLGAEDEITCGINGDMREGAEGYLKSIEICADEMPEGGEGEMKKQGGGM